MYNFSKLPAIFASLASLRRYRRFLRNNATIRALASVSLAALSCVVLSSTEVKAQVATLEGEIFQSTNIGRSRVTCDPPRGRIDFHVEGIATGPSPGTFAEDGIITFDPVSGTIFDVTIFFLVFDGANNVTVKGGKQLLKEGSATARCAVDPAKVSIFAASAQLSYDAKFTVGETLDSGQAIFDLRGSMDSRSLLALEFTEVFHSSNQVKSTLGKVTGGGNILQSDRGSGVTFGFNAQNTEKGMQGSGAVIDHNIGKKVKILDVTFFAVTGTKAVFMGRAEINGVEENYRIEVDDVGEPGTDIDTFKISTDSYRADGVLTGGNIQVHKGDTP